MKTTIEIDEPLLREAKEVAARSGTTLRELMQRGLRDVIAAERKPKPFTLDIKPFYGTGVRPGYENLTRDKINEIAYGDEDRFE